MYSLCYEMDYKFVPLYFEMGFTHKTVCTKSWWTYLQSRNRDADEGNRLVDAVREGEGGTSWGRTTDTWTLPGVKQLVGACRMTQGARLVPHGDRWVGWGEEGSRGRGHMDTYSWFTLWVQQKLTQYCKAIILKIKKQTEIKSMGERRCLVSQVFH